MNSYTEQNLLDSINKVGERIKEANKIRDAVAQLEQQMRDLPRTIENRLAPVRRISFDDRGNYRGVLGDEETARGFGLYVLATVGGDGRALEAFRTDFKDIAQNALGSDTTGAGGGLVPIEHSQRVQRLVEEYGVYAANAFRMPMTTDSLTFQRRVTGLTVYKTGQNTAATESQQTFATIDLNADEWNTLTLYPKAMGEDAATAIGEMIALDIVQAFAQAIDDAGFIGDSTPTWPPSPLPAG